MGIDESLSTKQTPPTAPVDAVVMRYFGILKPDGTIWWIADSRHNAWMAFFTYPSNKNEITPHRLPLAEAIEAYQSIGYRCIELGVREKMKLNNIEEYELKAEAFRIMTGHMAPGKDAAAVSCPAPYEEREAAWREWNAKHGEVARAMILALRVIDATGIRDA